VYWLPPEHFFYGIVKEERNCRRWSWNTSRAIQLVSTKPSVTDGINRPMLSQGRKPLSEFGRDVSGCENVYAKGECVMSECKVRLGTIIPDVATIKRAVRQIQVGVKRDSALARALQKDPRRFLADRGFSSDVQRELLAENGKTTLAKKCPCICTCQCTCCYTKARHPFL
jgi:hypothetical protein